MVTFTIIYKTSAQTVLTQVTTGVLPYVPPVGEIVDIRGYLFKVNHITSHPETNTITIDVFANAKR